MNTEQRKELIQLAKELLLDLVVGENPPDDEEGYIIWWLARQRFVNPSIKLPLRIKKPIIQKAESKCIRLIKLMKIFLTQERKNWHMERKFDFYDKDKVNKFSEIMMALRGKRDGEKIEETIDKAKEDTSQNPEIGYIQIPLVIEMKIDINTLPDRHRLLIEANQVIESKDMKKLMKRIAQSPYTAQILAQEEDNLKLRFPGKPVCVDDHGRPQYGTIGMSRLRSACAQRFREQKYIIEFKEGNCIVKILNYRFDGCTGIFIPYEDDEGGIGETGISFKEVDIE